MATKRPLSRPLGSGGHTSIPGTPGKPPSGTTKNDSASGVRNESRIPIKVKECYWMPHPTKYSMTSIPP